LLHRPTSQGSGVRVPFSYLREHFADPEPIFARLREVIAAGDFTLGAAVAEFEERFAELVGSRHAIGVNSGTDALRLSLKAVGVGPGDEVVTAANTFIATVGRSPRSARAPSSSTAPTISAWTWPRWRPR
jgi:DegT/DnrJ/EryC1/StrS aminotransferase family